MGGKLNNAPKINTSSETPPQVDNFTNETKNLKNNIELSLPPSQQLNLLKNNIEVPENYGKTIFEYLNGTDLGNTIEKKFKDENNQERLESRCIKIENLFSKGFIASLPESISNKLKNNLELQKTIVSGISLANMEWLSKLTPEDINQVSQFGDGEGNTNIFSTLSGGIKKVTGYFSKLKSFQTQMDAFSYLSEGIDIYQDQLITGDTEFEKLKIFQSPEEFARIIKKHRENPNPKNNFGSFEEYFNTENSANFDTKKILDDLNTQYNKNDKVHHFMKNVEQIGSQVTNKIPEIKNYLLEGFTMGNELSQAFFGKSLEESIQGTFLGKLLNPDTMEDGFQKTLYKFLGSIFGLTGFIDYKKKQQFKEMLKKAPEGQKNGLLQVIDFVEHNPSNKVSENFTKIFDEVNEKVYTENNIKKEDILTQLPDEDVIKKGIERVLVSDQSFFDITILKKYNISYEQYYTKDKQGNDSINPEKIKEFIDVVCNILWNKDNFMKPETIITMIKEGKNKTDITQYLLSGLISDENNNEKKEDQKQVESKKEDNIISVIEKGGSITRQEAIEKYGKTAAVRNFNPGNIMDTSFGGTKIEGERFTRFNTPQEGFQALLDKIKNAQEGGSRIYKPDMSLKQYMYKYAPPHENNTNKYIRDIVEHVGNITENTAIKDIDPLELAISHAKKEDGKSYTMLKDLGIIV